jgi:chaperonin GroES
MKGSTMGKKVQKETKKYPRPLQDRVLVAPIEENERTASGLFLPETSKEKPQMGKVLAVGNGAIDPVTFKRIPMEVKVGDKILFGKYSGNDIKVDGVEMLILKENEILAVV